MTSMWTTSYQKGHPGHDPPVTPPGTRRSTARLGDLDVAAPAAVLPSGLMAPKYSYSVPAPDGFATTAAESFGTPQRVAGSRADVLRQPRTDRAPPAETAFVDPAQYEVSRAGVLVGGKVEVGTGGEPDPLERLSMRGRIPTTKGAHGVDALVMDDEVAEADAALRRAEQEKFNRTAAVYQRPLESEDPVARGMHFVTTQASQYRTYERGEIAGAGPNFDLASNPVTVWSQPPEVAGAANGHGGGQNGQAGAAAVPKIPKHAGKQPTAPSTYQPSDMKGIRVSRAPPTIEEEMALRMRSLEGKPPAPSFTRHLRTTYRSEFVKKEPAAEVEVDETRLNHIARQLEETVRAPEANPRVTRNAEYGVPEPVVVPHRPSRLEALVARIREKIRSRGATTMATLSRHFGIVDDNGNKKLDKEEIKETLAEYGIDDLADGELEEIFSHFDTDGDGNVNVTEFLRVVRGPMSEKRRRVVELCFGKLDIDKNGYIDMKDIREFYDAKGHPDVLSGRKREQQVLREYLDNFDTPGKADGKVTLDEFVRYYNDVSTSIDDDAHFELMLRNAWKLNPKLLNRRNY